MRVWSSTNKQNFEILQKQNIFTPCCLNIIFRPNEIPVRDSVNVVMNKVMSSGDQDSGFSLPKEERIVRRNNLKTDDEHPAENLEARCQFHQHYMRAFFVRNFGAKPNITREKLLKDICTKTHA